MTPAGLKKVIRDLGDDAVVDLVTKRRLPQPVGSQASALPGVRGTIVRHEENGTVVRCPVRAVRHVLRLVA